MNSNTKPLIGLNAIVTGASKGIGAATACALAEAGANVAINYADSTEAAQSVLKSCLQTGVKACLAQADMGDQATVEQMIADTIAEFGALDIAVSNAAYSDRELFHTADMAGFERTIQVTMWGAFYLLRAVSRHMIQRGKGGSIVVMSSPHAYHPIPGAMAYNMAKAAIDQMAKTAATELIQSRIRVNILYPGWIDTPGERKFFSEQCLQKADARLPWGRLGKPEEIARGVVFMCDPASNYMTGSSMLIDGGIFLPVGEMADFRVDCEK